MLPPQSGGGGWHIVLPSIIRKSVCPSVTRYSTFCVSATPTVFKVMVLNLRHTGYTLSMCIKVMVLNLRHTGYTLSMCIKVSKLWSNFYTPPHNSGGVLRFHVGCPCVCPSVIRLSVHFSFPYDILSKHQWIFAKLGMSIDIVEIWFGIANGQISLKFLQSYLPATR